LLIHLLKLPLYQIVSQPKGPRGAKNLDKITITHSFVLDIGLDLALINARNAGFKKVKAIQMKQQYPIACPKCGLKEGHPVCGYHDRGYDYSKKEIPIPPIMIWWNHSKPKARHTIASLKVKKKVPILTQISKGIAFRKMRWYNYHIAEEDRNFEDVEDGLAKMNSYLN